MTALLVLFGASGCDAATDGQGCPSTIAYEMQIVYEYPGIPPHGFATSDATEALVAASDAGNAASVHWLLTACNAEVNGKIAYGDSALDVAAQRNHVDIVKLLIREGADVDDKDGKAPLHYAAEQGHDSIVKLLINEGANVNATDYRERIPLHYASRWGHLAVVKLLFSNNSRVDAVDFQGRSPLDFAARNGATSAVKMLLEKDADPNTTDWDGLTPLDASLSHGRIETAIPLIEHGADANKTLLLVAARNNHFSMSKPSFCSGVKSDRGFTPLGYRKYYWICDAVHDGKETCPTGRTTSSAPGSVITNAPVGDSTPRTTATARAATKSDATDSYDETSGDNDKDTRQQPHQDLEL